MDLEEKLHRYDNKEMPIVGEGFSDIVKLERECLLKIFECKDNIDSSIDIISIKEKKDEAQKELLDNLVDSRRNLFKKFFINYCQSKKLLKFSDKFSKDLKKYSEIEDIVRYNIGVKIFNEIKKDNILDLFDKPLEFNGIYELIDEFISKFVDSIDDYVYEEMPDGIEKDLLDDFLGYLKNIISKFIKLRISEDHDKLDLDALFDLISETIYASIDRKSLSNMYHEFLNNGSKINDIVEDKTNDKSNVEPDDNLDDDFDIVMAGVSKLVETSHIKGVDDLEDIDFSFVDGAKIADDAWDFVRKNPKFVKGFNPFDEDAFIDKMCSIVLDNESYDVWKKIFLRRAKFPVNTGNLKLMNIKDSENIMKFISYLREKYPKAKNHIGNIGSHKLKDKKVEFLSAYEKNLVNALSQALDDDSFKNLSLVQLFKIMHVYILVLRSNNFDLSKEFEEFLKAFLEQCFAESDQDVRGKEKVKGSKQELSQVAKEPEIPELVADLKVEQVQKKEGLSKELLEDLEFYFTHIDNSFSDDEKNAIIKILEKLPGKFYKRNWFKDYELNDIFFQNLDKNGYNCEDDSVEEESAQVEVVPEKLVKSDNVVSIPQLNPYFSGLDGITDIGEKIDKYFDVLKSLGYSFYKKEQKIKKDVVDLSSSNPSFFTSFVGMIVNLINGSQILEKKEKKWKNMPVYGLDIGGTGYRLVCLSRCDNEKKAIYAIMPHKEYITFLDKKCSSGS